MSEKGRFLIEKAESLSKEFEYFGRSTDAQQSFNQNIPKIFKGEGISSLIECGIGKGDLNSEEECKLYFLLSKYCANMRNYFLVSIGMVGCTIQKFGTPEQKDIFGNRLIYSGGIAALAITEPEVGSDLNAISTEYEFFDGKFTLNGKKKWITLGGIADIIMVVANGKKGPLVFLIDGNTHGIERTEIKGLLSNRGSHIAELSFKNVLLTRNDMLGGEECFSANAVSFALKNGRAIASIAAVAMASAALEEMVSYAKSRKQFGVRIWEHQLVQKLIGDAQTNVHAGYNLTKEAFYRKRKDDRDSTHLCSIAKLFSSTAIESISADAVQLLGANGISSDFSVERYYREAKAFQFIEGTSQILVQIIARGAITGVPQLWKN